jgi:hypothetical protein
MSSLCIVFFKRKDARLSTRSFSFANSLLRGKKKNICFSEIKARCMFSRGEGRRTEGVVAEEEEEEEGDCRFARL